jgi:hypothetical protein
VPGQSRAFGMAVALHQSDAIPTIFGRGRTSIDGIKRADVFYQHLTPRPSFGGR